MHDLTLVISDLGVGGAQRVAATLANEWARRNLRVCVITLSGPECAFFKLDQRITRWSLSALKDSHSLFSGLIASLHRVCKLRRALRASEAKVVLAFVGATNVLTILAATGLRLRVVISERNDPRRQSLGWQWDILRRLLYRRADVVTANSRGAIEAMRSFVPSTKLVFVPNPMSELDKSQHPAIRPQTILSVGRLARQKAQDVLLDAYARIGHAHQWRLLIIGEGELDAELRARAKTNGISDRVDWINRTAVPEQYYAGAGIFVLPSRFEGTPNSLLEAMNFGLPVVVSDACSGALEYVENEITGLVVPADDVDQLAWAMDRLIQDPQFRKYLGDAAKDRVGDYSSRSVLDVWESALGFTATDGDLTDRNR